MTDRIEIKDLLVRAILGINYDERANRQDVLINIALETDTRAPGSSDSIDEAVNYRTVAKEIIAMAESSQYLLVERLASEVARRCLSDPRVTRVQVSIEKPGAIRFARSVGVTISRTREDFAR